MIIAFFARYMRKQVKNVIFFGMYSYQLCKVLMRCTGNIWNCIVTSACIMLLCTGSLFPVALRAQNIVPNYSFESYFTLPTGYGNWFDCQDWDNVNGYLGFAWPWASPDYLHDLGGAGVNLPFTTFGTVDPHEGQAIMGFIAYLSYEPNFREYLSVAFTEPMVPGVSYAISFWITNGESAWYARGGVDKVGIRFSEGPLSQLDHEPIGGAPDVFIPDIFWNDAWELITFSFVADAPYDRLTLGNFYTDAATNYAAFAPSGSDGAYYFIDEVTVIPDTGSTVIDTTLCAGTLFTLPDGTMADTAGSYSVTLIAMDGADSIVTVNLNYWPVYDDTVEVEICSGASYVLPDGTVVADGGIYTSALVSVFGCDSVITTILNVATALFTDVYANICDGETYVLPDGTPVDSTGIYTSLLTTVSGCDSTVYTHLNVTITDTIFIDAEICSGESYLLPDGVSVDMGIYISVFHYPGCDSTVLTALYRASASDHSFRCKDDI
ncbi:MAG: hypothetical protein R2794_09255 [Chitinophagales bacterium]